MPIYNQAFTLVISIILTLRMNYVLLTFAWLFLIFLDAVWSGLSKALRILMFPGTLLYFGIVTLWATRFRRPLTHYRWISLFGTKTSFVLGFREPKDALYMIVSLFTVAILLSQLLFLISTLMKNIILEAIIVWMGISIYIMTLPRSVDLETLILSIWSYEPMAAVATAILPILFVMGIEIFGTLYSTILAMIYSLIVLALVPIKPRKDWGLMKTTVGEEIVIDEE